jgi:hypothetical protein
VHPGIEFAFWTGLPVSYSEQVAVASNNKKSLVSIAINYANYPSARPATLHRFGVPGCPCSWLRWEASAGVFFSTFPDRSFSVKPIYTFSSPSRSPSLSDNKD